MSRGVILPSPVLILTYFLYIRTRFMQDLLSLLVCSNEKTGLQVGTV